MIMTRPTKSPFSPYIPEQIEIKFPSRRVQLGSENPVQCKVKSILKLSTKKKRQFLIYYGNILNQRISLNFNITFYLKQVLTVSY